MTERNSRKTMNVRNVRKELKRLICELSVGAFGLCVVVFVFVVALMALVLSGCDTPYTGFLKAGDIDKYVENADKRTVCISDGFDSVCIRTVVGETGKDGRDGIDGIDGRDGIDGIDGRDGIDGDSFIAVKEEPIEVIVERIIEVVVPEIHWQTVYVPTVCDRVAEVIGDAEVPIETFVETTVNVITSTHPNVPVNNTPVQEVVDEVFVPPTPTPAPTPDPVVVEPPTVAPEPTQLDDWVVYTTTNADGTESTRVVHSSKVEVVGDQITLTGSDGEVDDDDPTVTANQVEDGLTQDEAKELAAAGL